MVEAEKKTSRQAKDDISPLRGGVRRENGLVRFVAEGEKHDALFRPLHVQPSAVPGISGETIEKSRRQLVELVRVLAVLGLVRHESDGETSQPAQRGRVASHESY